MTQRITRDRLVRFSTDVLIAAGVRHDDAELIGSYLAEADSRGFHSHGTDQLPSYFRGYRDGHLDAEARPSVESRKGSLAVVDGANVLGHLASDLAMGLAIEMAAESGVGIVSVHDSNHFGMAGHWPLKAIRENLVGFATTNGPPVMAPWGGRQGRICNNPFSWGIPAGEELPILLDMALTSGARGKVRLANQRGEEIPAGWALDPQGRPTTDAQAALDGVMLPLSEHKGSGVAIVNEVLASACSGALFLNQVTSTTMASAGYHASWRIGHFFMAFDPAALRPLEEFLAHVDEIIRTLEATPPAADSDGVSVPGHRGFRSAADAERLGVPLAPGSAERLTAFGEEAGVDFPVDAVDEVEVNAR